MVECARIIEKIEEGLAEVRLMQDLVVFDSRYPMFERHLGIIERAFININDQLKIL